MSSGERAATAMKDAPALAYEMAVSRPMPLEAPVIRTAQFLRPSFSGLMSYLKDQ